MYSAALNKNIGIRLKNVDMFTKTLGEFNFSEYYTKK